MKHDTQPEQRTAVLRARCAPDLKARVVQHARRRGHDEADIVRQAVIELLDRIESGASRSAAHQQAEVPA